MSRTARILIASASIASFALAALAAPPPHTKQDPVTDTYHGWTFTDPYRWLEPLEAESEEVRSWTTTQNDYTRAMLDNLPGRAPLEARLAELMSLPTIGAPTTEGTNYFNLERRGDQNQPILYVRSGHDGEPRILLDPNTLDKDGLISLDWYQPNHDGTLLAFGISRAGDENSICHILEVDTGLWLADEIAGKVNGISWMPDSSGFFYNDLADIKNPYSGRVRYHQLGTHPRQDKTLFEQYKEGPLATTWGPFGYASRDGRWLILGYYTSTKANDLWCVDLDHWFRTGEFNMVDIIRGDDSTSSGPVLGDTLFMQTTMDAPNGQVIAIDLNNPARDNWRTVIPERKDAVLESASLARGYLVATYLENASNRIELVRFDGTTIGEVPLPGIGSASINTFPDRTEAFITYTSFNDPRSVWRVNLSTKKSDLWARPDVPFDPDMLTVKQVWYDSKDGTKVSMFIVHRKDLTLDGANPTLLYGYGGFNISMTPYFSATAIPWLENGGVYALANLRGGGEYGEAWHEAGMLGRKQNVFDDFIAAAEYLIEKKYTSSDHLAVQGGSNGGLLTGAVLVQRPDLFAAIVSQVPLLDMLRYQDFLMARYWVPEYGTSEDPQHLEWLREYSPYQNIEENIKYPATLITAGENDTRVHPMHARKMVAALQAAATNDFDEDPILLWVDRDAGHGAGKPLRLRIRDSADIWSFVMWQTGMLDNLTGGR